MPLLPYVRRELFLQAIKNRDASALPDPNNREELFLKAIAEETALIPSGVSVVLPAEVSEMLANLPEAHTHTELFYKDIIDAILIATMVTDATPYLIRATADNAHVSSPARLAKKLGNTVGVNQLQKNGNFANTSDWTASNGTLTVSGNVGTFASSSSSNKYLAGTLISFVANHKYLLSFDYTSDNNFTFQKVDGNVVCTASNSFVNKVLIDSRATDSVRSLMFYDYSGSASWTLNLRNVICIDLTLWFGSNDRIPSDLLSHPENWGRYYAGPLDYNAGTLESADGTVMRSIGRNCFDEQTELGNISASTGQPAADNTVIRSKNYIAVIPNADYYINITEFRYLYGYDKDKNFIGTIALTYSSPGYIFTIPSNCAYLRIVFSVAYGTTYKSDTTISLYYPGESGYDQYYPYSVLAEVDTGSEVLRSAGSIADEKTPDGTITRRVGVVDLSTLSWTKNSSVGFTNRYYAALPVAGKADTQNAILNASYHFELYADAEDKSWWISGATIYMTDASCNDATAFTSAMSGIYLYYELATLTTEQGTAFDPMYDVEYGGTESWTNLKGIPQGHETEYTEYTT